MRKKRLEVIEFNQSLVFSIKSYIRSTKLYGLKRSMGRSTHHNSSPTFLLSSPCKAATFNLVEEDIDVLTVDVLIDLCPFNPSDDILHFAH
jgi:hypothetical protein